MTITGAGLFSEVGTFSVIADHPMQFLIASVFALLDTAVLYPLSVVFFGRISCTAGKGCVPLVGLA